MPDIISEIASTFYVTQLSVGSIILTVFALSASVFFLRPRDKSSATLHLGLALLFLAVFHFFFFVSFSFYHPASVYHRWFTVTFIFLGQIHMSRYILQYPDDRNRRLSRIVMIAQYALMIPVIITYFILTVSASYIFRFDGHYWDFNSEYLSGIIGLIIIANVAIHTILLVYKLFQLKTKEFYLMLVIGAIFILGALIPAILNSMNREGFIRRESFQTTLSMCHLFSFTLLALMHLNTTKDRFSFMGKIVGISSVTFLAVFILNSHFTLLEMNSFFTKLKFYDSKIEIHENTGETGPEFLNSYSFKENKIIITEKSSKTVPYSSYEYFNTAVYEEIKNLPDEKFTEGFKKIISNEDKYFSGYKDLIISYDKSLPADFRKRGEEICREIDSLQGYLQFNYNYIMNMPDTGFRDKLLLHLKNTSPEFKDFRDAINLYTAFSTLQGGDLKRDVLHFIEAMQPSGSLRFRAGPDGSHFVSSIYYDKTKSFVYEVGFSYLSYREFMHRPALRMVMLMVSVMLFMILIYPLFFIWTLYKPLSTLLGGVKRVTNGDLDFNIPVYSEDELGFITGTFNSMVNRLKENRDTISRSESRFRELNDLLPDIIYETDMDLNIKYMNKAGLDQTGYNADEIAKSFSFRQIMNSEELKSLEMFVKKNHGECTGIFSMTHEVIRKNGNLLKGENRAVFICDNEIPSGLRGIIRDVTDKLRTEEALLQLQKMETIGTLIAGLTHDFNNILGGISGPLSLLFHSIRKNSAPRPEELDLHLNTIKESVRRAADLVQQLVFISRRESTHLIPIDIITSINHVTTICSSAFDKNIEITKRLPDGEALIKGDPTQLEQMLLNICINANHAMTFMRDQDEPHGGKLIIEASRINADEHFTIVHPDAVEGPYWNISITDTGVGMDSDTLSKIFIPFYTTKERGSGTGLGLAMAYNIIRIHRGFIDVYSEPGSGTTFNLYIPLIEDKDRDLPSENEQAIPRGEGTILIADDEESIRLTARLMLQRCGYTVLTASDGVEALKIYNENSDRIKAVVLDLVMPRMSGEQVYQELIRINPEIKILLASGMLNDDRIEKLSVNEGCPFIQKPYTFANLAGAVYNLLNNICS